MTQERATLSTFVLCADDYAISEPVTAGILDLAERGRISATSCLVTSRHWFQHAMQLWPYKAKLDVGLHVNLIADELLQNDPDFCPAMHVYPRHTRLMLNSLFGRLDKKLVAREINCQLDRFVEGWGALPDFIDGHLHVHQLPVVQQALVDVYQSRLAGSRCYVRNVASFAPGSRGRFKAAVIAALGGRSMRRRLVAAGIPHNPLFGGVYNFSRNANYRELMRAWLRGVGEAGLLMCHPAARDTAGTDPIGDCRWHEYQYLRSEAFAADCVAAGAIPGRYWSAARPEQDSAHGPWRAG